MRAVSRDDELVQRGVNPPTGVVSPNLVTDSNGKSVGDGRIALGHPKEPDGGEREGSCKLKQSDIGWSLIRSPLFGPSAESRKSGRAVLADNLRDQFVAVMSGVDNPAPAGMTSKQIQKYQDRFRDIYINGRANPG